MICSKSKVTNRERANCYVQLPLSATPSLPVQASQGPVFSIPKVLLS